MTIALCVAEEAAARKKARKRRQRRRKQQQALVNATAVETLSHPAGDNTPSPDDTAAPAGVDGTEVPQTAAAVVVAASTSGLASEVATTTAPDESAAAVPAAAAASAVPVPPDSRPAAVQASEPVQPAVTPWSSDESSGSSGSDSGSDSDESTSSDDRQPRRPKPSATMNEGSYFKTVYSSGEEDGDEGVVDAGAFSMMSPRRVLGQLNTWRRRCHRLARRVATLESVLVGSAAMSTDGTRGLPGVAWVFRPSSNNEDGGTQQQSLPEQPDKAKGDAAGVGGDPSEFKAVAAAAPRTRPVELLDAAPTAAAIPAKLENAEQQYVQRVYQQQRRVWYGEQGVQPTEAQAGRGPAEGEPTASTLDTRAASHQLRETAAMDQLADEIAEQRATFAGDSGLLERGGPGSRRDTGTRWEDPWWLVSNLRRAAAAWQRGTEALDQGTWRSFARSLVLRNALKIVSKVCGRAVNVFRLPSHVSLCFSSFAGCQGSTNGAPS